MTVIPYCLACGGRGTIMRGNPTATTPPFGRLETCPVCAGTGRAPRAR